MSKIQDPNTYVLGCAYVVYGMAEFGSLIYFIFLYLNILNNNQYDQFYRILTVCYIAIAIIIILNFCSLTCSSYYLNED